MFRHLAHSNVSDVGSETVSDLSVDIDEFLDAYTEAAQPSDRARTPGDVEDPSDLLQRMVLEQANVASGSNTLSARRNARLVVETGKGEEIGEVKTPNRKVIMFHEQFNPRDSMSPEPLGWRKHRVMDSGSTIRGPPCSPSLSYSTSPPLASPFSLSSPTWRNGPGPTFPSSPTSISRPDRMPGAVPLPGFHDLPPPVRPSSVFSKEARKSYLRATRHSRHTPPESPTSPSSFGSSFDGQHCSPRRVELPRSPAESGRSSSGGFQNNPHTSPVHAQHPVAPRENTPWYEPGDEPVMTSRVRSRSSERGETLQRGHMFQHDVDDDVNYRRIDKCGKITVMDEYALIAEEERRRVFHREGAAEEDVSSRGPFILSPARETFLSSPEEEEEEESMVVDPRDGAGRGVHRNFLSHLYGKDDNGAPRDSDIRWSGHKKRRVDFGLADVSAERQAELEKTWKLLHRPP